MFRRDYDDLTFDLLSIVAPTAAPCDPTEVYTAGESCSIGNVFTLIGHSRWKLDGYDGHHRSV